jgi:phage tail-like protein
VRAAGVPGSGLDWSSPSAPGSWRLDALVGTPLLTYNFAVEIEGLLVGGFSEVSGLESTIEVEDVREGGVNGYVHKVAGPAGYGNLTFRHGLTIVSSLWVWFAACARGDIQRKHGTILLLDTAQLPVMWWSFRNALPVRWTGPSFDATSDQVGVEAIELAHEGLSTPLLGQGGT